MTRITLSTFSATPRHPLCGLSPIVALSAAEGSNPLGWLQARVGAYLDKFPRVNRRYIGQAGLINAIQAGLIFTGLILTELMFDRPIQSGRCRCRSVLR